MATKEIRIDLKDVKIYVALHIWYVSCDVMVLLLLSSKATSDIFSITIFSFVFFAKGRTFYCVIELN